MKNMVLILLFLIPTTFALAGNKKKILNPVEEARRNRLMGADKYELLTIGTFHSDEISIKDKSDIFALIKDKKGKMRLVRSEIKVRNVKDKTRDTAGKWTAKKVTLKENIKDVKVLLYHKDLLEREVVPLEGFVECVLKKSCERKYKAAKYRIKVLKRYMVRFGKDLAKPLLDLEFFQGRKSQKVLGISEIIFAGDIDGDSMIDLITDHVGSVKDKHSYRLYLSGRANFEELFSLQAKFETKP